MSEEKSNDEKQGAAMLPLTVELLHELLQLPRDIKIVCTLCGDCYPAMIQRGTIWLRIEGKGLPQGVVGADVSVINAIYETKYVPQFLRFERIDDGQEDPRPQPA